MTNNAVLQLRAERLARATRPSRSWQPHPSLPALPAAVKVCLCDTLVPATAESRFAVMFDTEPMKPSNTGRLIADILPDTAAFQWSRTEPPQALLDLVARTDYQPMVVFPPPMQAPTVRYCQPRHPENHRCLLCWMAPDGSAKNVP